MTKRKFERCPACSLAMVSPQLLGGEKVCVHCFLWDQLVRDKRTLGEAIRWTFDNNVCAYCGEHANEVEHVVPRHTGLATWTVRACSECNIIAGGSLFGTFAEKRHYIHGKLADRHKHLLRTPEWSEDELEEMGRGMAKSIRVAVEGRKILQARLGFRLEVIEAT